MSITEPRHQPTKAPTPAGPDPKPGVRRRRTVALAIGGVLAAGTATAFLGLHTGSSSPDRAAPAAALSAPATLAGLAPMATDPLQAPTWQAKARAVTGGAAFTARTYGKGGPTRSIRAVAARTDLTRTLELAWAADDGHAVGPNLCTQNVQLVPGGRIAVRPTVMVCWRKATGLTAYVAIIDPRATLTDADGGAAMDQLWTAVSGSK